VIKGRAAKRKNHPKRFSRNEMASQPEAIGKKIGIRLGEVVENKCKSPGGVK